MADFACGGKKVHMFKLVKDSVSYATVPVTLSCLELNFSFKYQII